MSHTRKSDQSVDAFSIPNDLFDLARARAVSLGMTRSGFYRYCLAKELGYSEAAALELSRHRAILNSLAQNSRLRIPKTPRSINSKSNAAATTAAKTASGAARNPRS